MKRTIVAIIVFIFFLPAIAMADWEHTLVQYGDNPVFDPATRAYYPTVLYDADGFGNGDAGPFYKMWYSDGTGISVVESDDGIVWSDISACVGLANPHHSKVIYDADGFGNGAAGPFYKMWYWDTSQLYSMAAIRYADSNDGIAWNNDAALTTTVGEDPIVTGGAGDWNRGSYGPVFVIYNPDASNSGGDPFDYTYAMYYDGTTGGFEQAGLGFSDNGTEWGIADPDPVLPSGADWNGPWGLPDPWDSSYAAFGTVIRDEEGVWHFWYSGGTTAIHEGIGHATSDDGIAWVRDADNPIVAPEAGTWIDQRAYTPTVLYDTDRYSGHGNNSQYKMWISGRDDGGNYAVGYYGRDVAAFTVELGEASQASQDIDVGATEVVVSQWKITNDNVEPVNASAVTLDLLGALLDRGAMDSVSIYDDLNGDGVLDVGTDALLGEAAPDATTAIALDVTVDENSTRYWIIVVALNDAAAGGDDLLVSLVGAGDFDAAGEQTFEAVKSIDVPLQGSILMISNPSPSPPSPAPVEGGGGCGCMIEAERPPLNCIWLLAVLMLSPVVFARLRCCKNS